MILTLSCRYIHKSRLIQYIQENAIGEYPNVLVQVFSGAEDCRDIYEIQETMKEHLPSAAMIGCTSAGEIYNGKMLEGETVITFSLFKETQVKTGLFKSGDYRNPFEMGKSIASALASYDAKALILFSAGFDLDMQAVLAGVYDIRPDIAVAGGAAGNHRNMAETVVFAGGETSGRGVSAAVLQNEGLIVEAGSNYKWQEIGKSFKVTKARHNQIFSIDDKKPLQILKQYLGEELVRGLPASGIEFPFLLEGDEEKASIFITKVLGNGAVEVNRPVKEGQKLAFAYQNIDEIIEASVKDLRNLARKPAEAFFVYACLARKGFLLDFTHKELSWLQEIAPVSGLFTYGEIAAKEDGPPKMVGHAFTYLSIREGVQHVTKVRKGFGEYAKPKHFRTLSALTHLMHASKDDIKMLNNSLSVSEQYYRSLFDNNADFVYSTDMQGNFTSINPAFKLNFGFNEKEVIGKPALRFIDSRDVARVRRHFYRTVNGKEQYYNLEIQSKNGARNLYELKNIPITVEGEPAGIYCIGRNITEQKRIEQEMTQLAYYDKDTGLPNRLKFMEELDDLLQKAKKKKRPLAVLFMDIDRFKLINDSLGHYAGDQILRQIAGRIEAILPPGSFFGRFSGDKFTLILAKEADSSRVTKLSNHILQAISSPVYYGEQEFFITGSIGASLYPGDGHEKETLMKNADIAMNRSKHQGGNRLTYYSTEMNEQTLLKLELESYLRKALQKKEFFLCYQPLTNLETGAIYGSEALIRWNHPKLGLVSPGDFIPLAEETGLINEIGHWVLQTACRQTKEWHNKGLGSLTVSVNVSVHQFQQPGFVHKVLQVLKETMLEPQFLVLELTESSMLRNMENSILVIQELQRNGIRVAIDDFGTGYSSLSYLKHLPIDALKIDRSFIDNLRSGSPDIAIVNAIITMGLGLHVKVVAEGVETAEQMRLLKDLKCHFAQGFFIHRPLGAEQFEEELGKKAALNLS